jgi:hypothetical protein
MSRHTNLRENDDWLERDNRRTDTHEGCEALDSDEELDAALRRELLELSGIDQHLGTGRSGRQ